MSIHATVLPIPGFATKEKNVPQELREFPQWILWEPIQEGLKLKKQPRDWRNPRYAVNPHDNQYWTTFENAVAAMHADTEDRFGIGFVLDRSGLVCVDYDDHPGGDVEAVRNGAAYVEEVLSKTPTYAERSVQGNGQHWFYRATLPHGLTYRAADGLSMEVYSAGFIAITGNALSAWQQPIADGQAIVDSWNLQPPVANIGSIGKTEEHERALDLTDKQVIETLMVRRPASFNTLATEGDLGERSDAFAYLIGDLDKITGDPEQIDRIIRKAPVFKSVHNSSRYERRTYSFEHWLRLARATNKKSIPYTEFIAPERRAFLDQVMAATLSYQQAINQERVQAPSVPEVPKIPAALTNSNPAQQINGDTSAIDYWAPATPASVPPHVLPHVLDELVQHVGDSTGLDKAALCVLALAACSMVTSDKIRIQPVRSSDRWRERFGLWGIGVGASGAGKSPLINIVGKPLKAVDKAIRDSWARRCDDLRKQATAEGKKLTDKELPPCPDLILGDTTTESAQDAMMCKNDGVGILDEEVTQFFAGIDRYTNSGKGDVSPNRALWLKSFDGIGDTVRRIGRGKFHIDNISVSIVGCIQPDPIKKISEAGIDDGMMQRITPVLLCDRKTGTDAPIQDVLDKYDALIYRLAELTGQHVVGGTHRDGATLFFSAEAQQVFRERQESTKLLTEHFSEIYPSLHMHLKKYDGILARLSLGLHMIEHASLPQQAYMQQNWISNIVEVATIRKAETLLFKFMLNHAMAFHLEILGSGQDATIRSIAGYILTHKVELVTLRDLQRNVAPCRELERRDYMKILDRLSADGWLSEVQPGPRSTSAPQGIVNPEVHIRFVKKAEEERARRDEIYRLASGIKYKGRV
ncbi:DUF3987 domain-containing protein [Rhizobium johnstonii]|uniref:DUF3987 domain-containing protein n=1 Tax=Rhizobium johnstonii TaxID=3019933 RepID=UPI003F9E2068